MTAEARPNDGGTPAEGLSETEAARRRAERGPLGRPATSRSYASIVRANVFTVFNLILLVFGVLMLSVGDWRDALFLGVLVSNASIGIVQETRAKHALERLAAVVETKADVVRDGAVRTAEIDDLVVGDLVQVAPGDQVVADGRLVGSASLALDEAVLTGESEAITRAVGDDVLSGSFVVEGSGRYIVRALGPESYAERVAVVARAFRHPRSPLERSLNRLLLLLVAAMVPLGAVLGIAIWLRDPSLEYAVTTAAAATTTLVPEGLILLTSLTYAVATLRMARRGALAQQLNAIESLAAAEVICLDKTGTLTERALRVVELVPAAGVTSTALENALGRFAASMASPNATLTAIASAYPREPARASGQVPFASRRRWSALELDGVGYLLGAPERFAVGELAERARLETNAGRRVLAFATSQMLPEERDELSAETRVLGLVVLAERLRPEAQSTVAFLRAEGVRLKVLSGDAPATVAAIAADAGLPRTVPFDASSLPEDAQALRELVLETDVFGRVSPDGKRRIVESLRDAGVYVAMVGDGVNDVPALKAARLGIGLGSGVAMAKSVADLVLVRDDFSAVPALVAEGRQILRNLQRVTKLFVTRAVLAAFLILAYAATQSAYPFLPRHLTLASAIAVGIPAFFLALAPSSGRWEIRGFLGRLTRFAVPAGIATGAGVVTGFLVAERALGLSLVEARTVATTVLVAAGLYVIVVLEATGRRRAAGVAALCAALGAAYLLVLAVPAGREFFALAAPSPAIATASLAGTVVAIASMAAAGLLPGRDPGTRQGAQ
ncbi:MAG TPA: HAD-IC family P-type ATPase [Gaiellaceae bacterium]|nr:HAD-IC family P-type ATPase [Gaiellaceae bacterium]